MILRVLISVTACATRETWQKGSNLWRFPCKGFLCLKHHQRVGPKGSEAKKGGHKVPVESTKKGNIGAPFKTTPGYLQDMSRTRLGPHQAAMDRRPLSKSLDGGRTRLIPQQSVLTEVVPLLQGGNLAAVASITGTQKLHVFHSAVWLPFEQPQKDSFKRHTQMVARVLLTAPIPQLCRSEAMVSAFFWLPASPTSTSSGRLAVARSRPTRLASGVRPPPLQTG